MHSSCNYVKLVNCKVGPNWVTYAKVQVVFHLIAIFWILTLLRSLQLVCVLFNIENSWFWSNTLSLSLSCQSIDGFDAKSGDGGGVWRDCHLLQIPLPVSFHSPLSVFKFRVRVQCGKNFPLFCCSLNLEDRFFKNMNQRISECLLLDETSAKIMAESMEGKNYISLHHYF